MEKALAGLGLETFRRLSPRRIVKLDQVTNPLTEPSEVLYANYLEVYVIDSAITPVPGDTPVVATIIVPKDRERDLLFDSDQGRHRLILKYDNVSRLILISNKTCAPSYYTRKEIDEDENLRAKFSLRNIIHSLLPAVCLEKGLEDPNFIEYEDELMGIVGVVRTDSIFHGEIRVEGIELAAVGGGGRDFRRRMTFRNCPDCVQCDLRVVLVQLQELKEKLDLDSLDLALLKTLEQMGIIGFQVNTSEILQPEVQGMLAALSLLSEHLQQKLNEKKQPKALCLGVGSGSLISFLKEELQFSIVGVEKDDKMVVIAEELLGLVQDENLGIIIGNGAHILQEVVTPEENQAERKMFSKINGRFFSKQFDIIVLDVNSGVDRVGTGNSSPTVEFLNQQFYTESKVALAEGGLLIINVDSPDFIFCSQILKFVKKTFNKVYRINMTSKNKFILIGKVCSEATGDSSKEGAADSSKEGAADSSKEGAADSSEKVDGESPKVVHDGEVSDNGGILRLMDKLKACLNVPPMFFDSIFEI